MSKKSKKNYVSFEVPLHQNYRSAIKHVAQATPDAIAFRYTENKKDRTVTYKEHLANMDALGTAIAHAGFHNAKVAMLGENCYEWALAQITVLSSDNVFVPIDKDLPVQDIVNVINHSDTELLLCTERFIDAIEGSRSLIPNVRLIICFGAQTDLPDGFADAKDMMSEGRILAKSGDTSFTGLMPADNRLAEIVYTSGTTGAPKGVMISQHNLLHMMKYGLAAMNIHGTSLSVLPYNHTYEGNCDILGSQCAGATICINENLKTVALNMKKYQPDYVMLVPLFVENFYKRIVKTLEKDGKLKTVQNMMARSNKLRKVGIDMRPVFFKEIRAVFGGNLEMIICGGAPIRAEIAEFFENIGIFLNNGYGITECCPLVSVNRRDYSDYRSVGVPLDCVQVRIDSPNENGEGEILVKGDTVMIGYYKDPEMTAEVFTQDGWFRTGDYGKMTEDRVYITGRKKNLIVLKNGKNVYPEEIEEYIQQIPEVEEVVVRAIKDDEGFETGLFAEIFPNAELTGGMQPDDLKDELTRKIDEKTKDLPGYKHITAVILRNTEFPKTTSKKIKRQSI